MTSTLPPKKNLRFDLIEIVLIPTKQSTLPELHIRRSRESSSSAGERRRNGKIGDVIADGIFAGDRMNRRRQGSFLRLFVPNVFADHHKQIVTVALHYGGLCFEYEDDRPPVYEARSVFKFDHFEVDNLFIEGFKIFCHKMELPEFKSCHIMVDNKFKELNGPEDDTGNIGAEKDSGDIGTDENDDDLEDDFVYRKFKSDPKRNLQGFREDTMQENDCHILEDQAYMAKWRALKILEGDPDEQFAWLWDYAIEIKRTNPGSTVIIGIDQSSGENLYDRFSVGFHALKVEFSRGCRTLIGVDGCHLKEPHQEGKHIRMHCGELLMLTENEFIKRMEEMNELNANAFDWFNDKPPDQWYARTQDDEFSEMNGGQSTSSNLKINLKTKKQGSKKAKEVSSSTPIVELDFEFEGEFPLQHSTTSKAPMSVSSSAPNIEQTIKKNPSTMKKKEKPTKSTKFCQLVDEDEDGDTPLLNPPCLFPLGEIFVDTNLPIQPTTARFPPRPFIAIQKEAANHIARTASIIQRPRLIV
ncbi:hypothetical protein BUALT_Bualt19G0076600 [Buddleja alternifolia]|uniref:Uncharacterized protein n=1 Tax=Buddleja alternifolia TaxID=168488 RepID=A0AAV6W1X6_9LAMI|nr:hypothetical protein BUALT_Bualt19G0076600 [Buddleja alternifolia]